MNHLLEEPVRKLVELLVAGKYVDIQNLTAGSRLSADEIGAAIKNYGRTLVLPPRSAFASMDVVAIVGGPANGWSVAMPLWTEEEGRSDLTAELTVTEKAGGFAVELDDLHVL